MGQDGLLPRPLRLRRLPAQIHVHSSQALPPQLLLQLLLRQEQHVHCLSTGLADADFSALVAPQDAAPDRGDGSVSAQDFAFLHEHLVFDHDAHDARHSGSSGKSSDDAVSICNVINLAQGGNFDANTEKFLRQYRGKLNEALVIDVLKMLKSPELGVKFFIWAGRQIGYQHTGPAFHALSDTLGFDSNDKVLARFVREIRDDDAEIFGRLLNVLIRKCCKNGSWNRALEELGRLKDFGYKPSRVTYNSLIQVMLKANRLDSAFLVHLEMSDAGFTMDGLLLVALQDRCARQGGGEKLSVLWRKKNLCPTQLSIQR